MVLDVEHGVHSVPAAIRSTILRRLAVASVTVVVAREFNLIVTRSPHLRREIAAKVCGNAELSNARIPIKEPSVAPLIPFRPSRLGLARAGTAGDSPLAFGKWGVVG
jgi:hypothetical protein